MEDDIDKMNNLVKRNSTLTIYNIPYTYSQMPFTNFKLYSNSWINKTLNICHKTTKKLKKIKEKSKKNINNYFIIKSYLNIYKDKNKYNNSINHSKKIIYNNIYFSLSNSIQNNDTQNHMNYNNSNFNNIKKTIFNNKN